MDRRAFLRYGVAATAGALFGSVRAEEPATVPIGSIDELLAGGTPARCERLEGLADDQRLTTYLAGLYSLPREPQESERKKVVWTLRELARLTHPDRPTLYSYGEAQALSINHAIRAAAPHLEAFARIARTSGMDDRFLIAKIARESNGDPWANTGALGLTQVEPATYEDHVRWARQSVASNRAVLPNELYDEFIEGERPLRDALLFTPELAEREGLALEQRTIGSEEEYLDRWLPFGIMIEKHHAGAFPSQGGAYESLLDPETNLEAGGLVSLSYLLRLNHVTKQAALPEAAYDPAQVLARSATPPQALAAAFNGGDGRASGILRRAINAAEEVTRHDLADAYDRLDKGTRDYRSKVLASTGALQSATTGSITYR
jgi:hypothetical protein